MANVDAPRGLQLIGTSLGASFNARVEPMYVAATYGVALFVGDPVVIVAGGSNTAVERDTTGGEFAIGTLPNVERASIADDGIISGVIVSIAPSTQNSVPYSPASTEGILYVCTDPFALYEIQGDTALVAANVGLNAIGLNTHAGNTATGLSGLELDASSAAADASMPFTIERLKAAPDNETNAEFNKIIVRINGSTRMPGNPGEIGI